MLELQAPTLHSISHKLLILKSTTSCPTHLAWQQVKYLSNSSKLNTYILEIYKPYNYSIQRSNNVIPQLMKCGHFSA